MMIPAMHEKWSEPYDRIIQQGISNTNDQNSYLKYNLFLLKIIDA